MLSQYNDWKFFDSQYGEEESDRLVLTVAADRPLHYPDFIAGVVFYIGHKAVKVSMCHNNRPMPVRHQQVFHKWFARRGRNDECIYAYGQFWDKTAYWT